MKTLNEQIKEAIEGYATPVYDNIGYVIDAEEAAEKCEEIADNITIEFAEWCSQGWCPSTAGGVLKYWQKGSYQNKEKYYSTKELLQIFKEENK